MSSLQTDYNENNAAHVSADSVDGIGLGEDRRRMKVNNSTLTKDEQDDFLRKLLPACQPQEGSPKNTFTRNELDELKKAVSSIEIKNKVDEHKTGSNITSISGSENKIDIRDLQKSFCPPEDLILGATTSTNFQSPEAPLKVEQDQNRSPAPAYSPSNKHRKRQTIYWHGAPRALLDSQNQVSSSSSGITARRSITQLFRDQVRRGEFVQPTNGVCPGFLQCNLVVLPQGPIAFDFLLFCQRNPKACPLIEVCDVGSPKPIGVAPDADLRTDVPKYAIYRDGKLDREVTDVTDFWPKDSVAFLIGCSFSYDGELMNAGIPLKSARQGKNVPMYKTSLKCRSAGSLNGNMVVSMKPIPAIQVSKHVEITSKYTHAHGGPVAVGSGLAIGIRNVQKPEFGESIDISHDEVSVFHACGVTPQSVLMDSKVPFAITHSPGYMFVTDLPSDMGC